MDFLLTDFCFDFCRPSPRPQSSLARLSSMSPAARKLAASHLSSRVMDNALKASYTPIRISTPSMKTPTLSSRGSKTPVPGTPLGFSGKMTPGVNLTDNLLNLPKSSKNASISSGSSKKRPSAAEFFNS